MRGPVRPHDRPTLAAALADLEEGNEIVVPHLDLAKIFGSAGVIDDNVVRAARIFAEEHGCWLEYGEFTRAPPIFHKPKDGVITG